MALAVQTVSAQNLFSTYSDFTGWANSDNGGPPSANPSTVGPSSAWDYDGSTINGAGNNPGNSGGSINVGGSSAAGSLSVTWGSSVGSYGYPAFSPGEAYNPSFMHTIDPGSLAAYSAESGYGQGTTVAYTGTINMVYTKPDDESGGGGYFQLGIVLNYNGNFGQFFGGPETSLGMVDGQPAYEVSVPYTINAGGPANLNYFMLGVIYNSNYQPVLPFNIDSISVVPVPEPSSLAFAALGGLCMFRVVRRRK
jgi:hypothetical protein